MDKDNSKKYQAVMDANISLHTKLASEYSTVEPHFRPENICKVEVRLKNICEKVNATKLLDLGCGTGFIINIARKYVSEIVGVDITQAMLDRVEISQYSNIKLICDDTGNVTLPKDYFDVVTAYSFLHHLFDLRPTLLKAYEALKAGGIFYADLDPNFYFWEKISTLDPNFEYDLLVKNEVEKIKGEPQAETAGIATEIFNLAEYGKSFKGGFKEEEIISCLKEIGFSEVIVFHHWFLGEALVVNDPSNLKKENIKEAEKISKILGKAMPISRPLFKYLGFYATK